VAFFFVLKQKRNKKIQGKHERSAHFAVPAHSAKIGAEVVFVISLLWFHL
jgi:hypothetical protein